MRSTLTPVYNYTRISYALVNISLRFLSLVFLLGVLHCRDMVALQDIWLWPFFRGLIVFLSLVNSLIFSLLVFLLWQRTLSVSIAFFCTVVVVR